jgi:hypothetical protein
MTIIFLKKSLILSFYLFIPFYFPTLLYAQCNQKPYILSANESYTLTAQSGLTNIQWYVDKGFGRQVIAAPSGTSANLVADTEGSYFYTAQDINGCQIDLCCPIRLQKCPDEVYSLGSGESYTLAAQSGLTNIQWYVDKGNGKTPIPAPDGNASTFVAATDGWFSYTARDANDCFVELCCPIHIKSCNTIQYPLCTGESYTLTAQSGLRNVQWFVKKSNGNEFLTAANSVRADSTGVYFYTALDSNDCPIELCCPFHIVTQPSLTITTQPESFKECIGGTNTLLGRVATSSDSSNLRYQWQISTDSLVWSDIPNANNVHFTPLSNQATIRYYRLLVHLYNSICPALTSQAVKVEIWDKPTISITSTNTVVCLGGSVVLNTTFVDKAQSCTIQWQSSVNDGATWANIVGATNTSLQVTNFSQSTRYRAALICTLSGCCN